MVITPEIEAGIPLPPARVFLSYPYREMAVGDSVFLAEPRLSTKSLFNRASARASQVFGSGNYTARVVTENGAEGVRVWRTK